MKYKTFIFDFDFTLVDAAPGIIQCVNYALNKAGLEPASPDDIRKTIGMTLPDMLYNLKGIQDKGIADKFYSDFIFMADKIMLDSTSLFDDTINVLSKLKKEGCNTAIVSTKLHRRIDEVIYKYDISELIDYVIGIEDVTKPKPSPEGILKTIEYFGCDLSSILFIGDTLIDAKTAANASVDFAAVLTGTTEKAEFVDLPYAFIAKNLTELIDTLYISH